MEGLDWGVMLRPEYRGLLLKGIATTLQLTVVALAGGLSIGTLVTLARHSRARGVSALATAFVEVTRTVPLLVHLMFWYFAGPEFLPAALKTRIYEHGAEFWSAAIALSLYASAFISEDLRSGIRGIPAGQADAARSLGFTPVDAFRLVLLPQAVRAMMPALFGQALTIARNTTVALMIGVPELAHVARTVQSASFQSVSIYVFTTAFFLLLAVALTGLARLWPAGGSAP